MIQIKNLRKSYGETAVLKGLDLEIKQAEVLSIMGDSGAGKTTFLQILGTLDQPDSGEVLFENTAVHKLNEQERSAFRNKSIGFVFQFHHLLPEFSALENVSIPAWIAGDSKAEGEAKAKALLERLGLGDKMQNKPKEMSGGEQQRVAVARALVNKPKLILADEPSGNLDSKNALALHELFMELKTEFQQSFVIVTHNKELSKISDNQLFMKDGIFQ